MKHFLLTNFISVILLNAAVQNSSASIIGVNKYVDVFHQHMKILDAVIAHGYDNTNVSYNAIMYMERVTHIKAHGEGDYGGFRPFTIFDLNLWKTWYKNIGSKRIGMIP